MDDSYRFDRIGHFGKVELLAGYDHVEHELFVWRQFEFVIINLVGFIILVIIIVQVVVVVIGHVAQILLRRTEHVAVLTSRRRRLWRHGVVFAHARVVVVLLSLFLDRFSLHAGSEAFLVATVLAAVALALVNLALTVVTTRVGEVFADRSLEEAFAAFAAKILFGKKRKP